MKPDYTPYVPYQALDNDDINEMTIPVDFEKIYKLVSNSTGMGTSKLSKAITTWLQRDMPRLLKKCRKMRSIIMANIKVAHSLKIDVMLLVGPILSKFYVQVVEALLDNIVELNLTRRDKKEHIVKQQFLQETIDHVYPLFGNYITEDLKIALRINHNE